MRFSGSTTPNHIISEVRYVQCASICRQWEPAFIEHVASQRQTRAQLLALRFCITRILDDWRGGGEGGGEGERDGEKREGWRESSERERLKREGEGGRRGGEREKKRREGEGKGERKRSRGRETEKRRRGGERETVCIFNHSV